MQQNIRRREIIYIPIDCLVLDGANPRLAGEENKSKEEDIISSIYINEELEELAGSLALHGFLPEEPIIVVPCKSSDFDQIENDNVQNFKYTVVEGNRRISSVKLLLDNSLRATIDVEDGFPIITDLEVKDNLQTIPAIIYKERSGVDAYLGIRHISGNRKWDAYAKAKYIYDKVDQIAKERNLSISEAIEELKHQISDRKDVIRKLYIYYSIFTIIEDEVVNYKSKHIKDRFSLIQVALGAGRTTIAEYLGLKPFKDVAFDKELIDPSHIEKLKNVTKWIFGLNEEDNSRIISDSRFINGKLSPVLGNKESTEYLEKTGNLEGAYQLTDGEEEFVKKSLSTALRKLDEVMPKMKKYRDNKMILDEIGEIESSLSDIKKLLLK